MVAERLQEELDALAIRLGRSLTIDSVDGELIAYSTQAGDIWVMDADGSSRRQVTRTRDPAFGLKPVRGTIDP